VGKKRSLCKIEKKNEEKLEKVVEEEVEEEEMKVLRTELRKTPFSPYISHIVSPKKRQRRTAAEIQRPYACPVLFCQKAYGTETALKTHIKLKHKNAAPGQNNNNNTTTPTHACDNWVVKKEVPEEKRETVTETNQCLSSLPLDMFNCAKDFLSNEFFNTIVSDEDFFCEVDPFTAPLSPPPQAQQAPGLFESDCLELL